MCFLLRFLNFLKIMCLFGSTGIQARSLSHNPSLVGFLRFTETMPTITEHINLGHYLMCHLLSPPWNKAQCRLSQGQQDDPA